MSKFVLKNPHCVRVAATTASRTHNLHFLQIRPFSSSLKSNEESLDETSFTVNYLINSCGFTPERALSASKYVKFKVPDKPDSVLTFFKDHGFTKTQISHTIKNHPSLLLSNPEKTLLPKLDFLKSKGMSGSDIALVLSRSGTILKRSLENHLMPSFNTFSNLVQSDENTISAIKRFGGILFYDLETYVLPNIEMLKAAGVPIRNIEVLLRCQPRSFMTTYYKFRQIVEDVREMGFNPLRKTFILAVHVLRSMTKSTWDRKVEVFKKWDWSENDIVVAFRKYPLCMASSEDKITSVMKFWVDKLGWKSSFLAGRPSLISLSLEKRIVPRCEVYQALLTKGLTKPGDISLLVLLVSPEKRFLRRFIECYKEEALELLKLYKEKLDLAK